jgi:methyl-accepting chemotaxis protein
MAEVVSSIRRVTDIMGEISVASTEQALGVVQVGEAVTQMDRVTQQNAALVQEMAAAASGLNAQAQNLVQTVSVFKVGRDAGVTLPAPAPRRALAPRPAPRLGAKGAAARALAKPKVLANAALTGGETEWETS